VVWLRERYAGASVPGEEGTPAPPAAESTE
jgi:hypothetical protein